LGIIALLDNPCDINNQSLNEEDFNQVVISPNPSSGIFNITGIQSKEFTITIVNACGQMIKKQNTTSVDLSDCSNGLYFINIVDANGVSTLKSVSLTK
jgi:urea transporter